MDLDFLPIELYEQIFCKLNVQDLKACREVCTTWFHEIERAKLFSSKTIIAWNAETMTAGQYWKHFFELLINNIILRRQELRLQGFGWMASIWLKMSSWNETFAGITSVEVVGLEAPVDFTINEILFFKFEHLKNLSVTYAMPGPPPPGQQQIIEVKYLIRVMNLDALAKLETLKFTMGEIRVPFDQTIGRTFFHAIAHDDSQRQNLKVLCLEILESDKFDKLQVYEAFVQIMHNNAKTLREVTLTNYNLEFNSARKNPLHANDDLVSEDKEVLFCQFLTHLESHADWEECGLSLEKLHLRFPLVNIQMKNIHRVLLPFLKTQTKLKSFSLSQIFVPPRYSSATVQGIQNYLPSDCCTLFEFLPKFRPSKLEDHHLLMHPLEEGPPGYEDEDDFPEIHADKKLIRRHQDSKVVIRTDTVDLTFFFVFSHSLERFSFLTDNICKLTKLKIDQGGVVFKISMGDADIQKIIANSKGLTELCLECCDLLGVTDFGLTGIRLKACLRIASRKKKNMEFHDADLVGLPISDLTKLSSLKLSNVGAQVTDISAYHAFNGLQSLSSFGISKPSMTSKGYRKLGELFQSNQLVKIDTRLKILIDKAICRKFEE